MRDETAPSGGNPFTERVEDALAGETGRRRPLGWAGGVLVAVAVTWSLFQLWIASPLPVWAGIGIFNNTEARSIHLAFAIFLVFLAFPRARTSPHHRIPWGDWLMAALGAFCAGYLFLFYNQLADRPGNPT